MEEMKMYEAMAKDRDKWKKEVAMVGNMADDSMQKLHSIAEARVARLELENDRLKSSLQLYEHENAMLIEQCEKALDYLHELERKLSIMLSSHPSTGIGNAATRSSEQS
jgi:hypothetical protein